MGALLATAACGPKSRDNANADIANLSQADKDHLTVAKVTVKEVADKGFGQMGNLDSASYFQYVQRQLKQEKSVDLPSTDSISWDVIVNIGKQIWDIVQKNQPVVTTSNDVAYGLPEGVRSASQLDGWMSPKSKVYQVTYENLFGMTVADFTYRVMFTPGGNLQGRGRYLTEVTILPADLAVSWGYKFNAQATVPSVVNSGTKQNPVASAQLVMKWSVDTVLRHMESSTAYVVRGDGTFEDISSGTK